MASLVRQLARLSDYKETYRSIKKLMANLDGSSNTQFTFSNIIGILAFAATVLTFAATFLGQIDPQYSVWALAIAAAINAFTGRITGSPVK